MTVGGNDFRVGYNVQFSIKMRIINAEQLELRLHFSVYCLALLCLARGFM